MGAVMEQFNQGFEELGIEVSHHMPDDGSGVYAKGVFIPAGRTLLNHSHTFTHKSILAFGTVMVKQGRKRAVTYHGPAVLVIKNGVKHKVTSITDAYWFCIHASDENDPNMIDYSLIKNDGSVVIDTLKAEV